MANKFEIKIDTDPNDVKVDLDKMSIELSELLISFLQALTELAKQIPVTTEDVKIQVKKGSVCTTLEAGIDGIEYVEREINLASQGRSENPNMVKPLARIQSLISANGYTYDVNIIKNDRYISLTSVFKGSDRFREVTPEYNPPVTNLKFYSGRMNSLGGKRSINFHIDTSANTPTKTVSCSQEEAFSIRDYLYRDINVAVWATAWGDNKIHYRFCDFYTEQNSELFEQFKNDITAFQDIYKNDETEACSFVFEKIKTLLDQREYTKTNKFMKLFCDESYSPSILKTILTITKSFKDNPSIMAVRAKILEKLEKIIEQKLI